MGENFGKLSGFLNVYKTTEEFDSQDYSSYKK